MKFSAVVVGSHPAPEYDVERMMSNLRMVFDQVKQQTGISLVIVPTSLEEINES